MKRIFALLAALCLLGSCALAEEETDPFVRYDWTDGMAEEAAAKEYYKVNLKAADRGLSFYLPAYLKDAGVPEISEGVPAVYADEANARTMAAALKTLPEGKDLAARLQAMEASLKADGWDHFSLIMVNDASGVRMNREGQKEDAVMFPVTDSTVIILTFSPADNEEFRTDYERTLASLEAVE